MVNSVTFEIWLSKTRTNNEAIRTVFQSTVPVTTLVKADNCLEHEMTVDYLPVVFYCLPYFSL